MKAIHLLVASSLVVGAGLTVIHASDRTALYARVDRVVLEPNAGAPGAIQVWGVFAMAKLNDRDDYLPAARGYLYLKIAGNEATARKEWADLRAVAGTGQIVSFGSRYELRARLRKPDERPGMPDPYAVSIGLTRVRGNTDYAPVRGLLDYKD